MKVAIRVDSSAVIGTGHVMRCLALATEMKVRGCQVEFYARSMVPLLENKIKLAGFKLITLASQPEISNKSQFRYADWLTTSEEADFNDFKNAIDLSATGLVVVDHYGISSEWHSLAKAANLKVMVIDDLADRPLDCDILLDPNYGAGTDITYGAVLKEAFTQTLMGPRYALLREEFKNVRQKKSRRERKELKAISLFIGGGEVCSQLLTFAEGLKSFSNISFIWVAPSQEVRTQLLAYKKNNWVVLEQAASMAELFYDSDLCIGAGGSTTWERMCMGAPALAYALSHNQLHIARRLERDGYQMYMGDIENFDPVALESKINELSANPNQLERISRKIYDLVDGLGVSRVCDVALKH